MATYRRKMQDATGAVRTYRTNSNAPSAATGHREPPALPDPDEVLLVNWSGYFIPPGSQRVLAEVAAYYAAHPESEGEPISGDETARARYSRCGDPSPDAATGCRGADHCPAAPHEGGRGWITGRVPRYRNIAHTLYPGGVVPTPVGEEEGSEHQGQEPEQLDLLAYLSTL